MTPLGQPIRLLQLVALACFETTLIHLSSSLLMILDPNPPIRWYVLLGVVAAAALTTAHLEPVNAESPKVRVLTWLLAAATILFATSVQAGRDGTGRGTLAPLLSVEDPDFFRTYAILVTGLLAWWRGARLVDYGHAEVVRVMRNGVIVLVTIIILLALGSIEVPLAGSAASNGLSLTSELVIFLGLGLVSLSLTRIVTAEGDGSRIAQWRWLRSGVFSTIAVLAVGLLASAVVAEPARQVLRSGLLWTTYLILLVLSPLFWLIFQLFEMIRAALLAGGLIPPLPPLEGLVQPEEEAVRQPSPLDALAPLLTTTSTLVLLIPILVLMLVILFAVRRRGRTAISEAEERESLFSWSAVGNDLADLLRGLRRPHSPEAGLAAALRRLGGSDPATRIRRRYVQLLLAGENAGVRRSTGQTPDEFAPELGTSSRDSRSVAELTELYDRARYSPGSVDDEAAARAEETWQALAHDQHP